MRVRRTVGIVGLVLGVVLMLGSLALVIANRRARSDSGDERAATATVTAVSTSLGGTTGPNALVDYTFATPDGVVHAGRLALTRPSSRFVVGGEIDVTYPADDPSNAHVVGEVRDAWALPWFVPLLLGATSIAIGAAASNRLRWINAVLRDNPWVVAESTLIERPIRMLQLHGAPDDGAALVEPLSWRGRAMAELVPQAWVAGDGRRFLVAAPGGSPVLRMRRVRLVDDPLAASDAKPLPSRLAGDDT